MEAITAYKTRDGEIFTNKKDAVKHIEKRIGDIMLPLCHKILQMKYQELSEFIYNEIDDFVCIDAWKKDLELWEDDE